MPLKDSDIARIIDKNLGCENQITQIQEMTECRGRMNTLFKVELDSEPAEVVVRLRTNPNYLYDQNEINEVNLPAIFNKSQVKIPKLFAADNSKELVPYVYTIIEYIQGKKRTSQTLTLSEIEKLGSVLAEIHKVKYKHYGRLSDVTRYKGNLSYKVFLIHKIKPLFDQLAAIDETLGKAATKFFSQQIDMLTNPEPTLLHYDFQMENFIFNHTVNVLDWDGSQSGAPEKDWVTAWYLILREREDLFYLFMQGYQDTELPKLTKEFWTRFKTEEALWLCRLYIFELLENDQAKKGLSLGTDFFRNKLYDKLVKYI